MFNDIYSVEDGNKRFAVKVGILATELLLEVKRKGVTTYERRLLCEMPDDFRALVHELNNLNQSKDGA